MSQKISIIVAMDKNRVIGNKNRLPSWKAPGDLKRFKELTTGKVVVMGRKTFESIGKPLPNRLNVVVSKSMGTTSGIVVVRGISAALEPALAQYMLESGGSDEIMVIGGSQIYEQTIDLATNLYVTQVHGEFEGDSWFPVINPNVWNLVSEEHVGETHSYQVYERMNAS